MRANSRQAPAPVRHWHSVCIFRAPSEEPLRYETILVVDDADTVRRMICAMLSQSGYECLEAADGAEALGIVESRDGVDLVLTDVVMPRMGGGELARHLAT